MVRMPRSWLPWVALATLIGAVFQYRSLTDAPFLPGSDIYYYALQVRWILETGHLKIPDSSPVHWLMVPFAKIAGTPALGVALYSIVTLLALKAVLLVLIQRSLRGGAFLLSALWLSCSPSLFIASYEFPRQFLAALTLAAAWLALDGKGARTRRVGWTLTALAPWLHPSLVLGSLCLGYLQIQDSRLKEKLSSRRALVVSGTLIAGLVGLTWLVFSGNAARFSGGMTVPGLYSLVTRDVWGPLVLIELLIAIVIAQGGSKRFWVASLFAVAPAFLPFFNAEPMSLGVRTALLAPLLFHLIASKVGPGSVEPVEIRGPDILSWPARVVAFAILIAVQWFTISELDRGLYSKYEPRNEEYALVEAELRELPKPPLLIVKLGLNYFLKYSLQIETFPYEPEVHWDKRLIWRLVDGVETSYFFQRSSGDCKKEENVRPLRTGKYVLVREDCFAALRAGFERDVDEIAYERLHDHRRNPSQHRPEWLYSKYAKGPSRDEDPRFPARDPNL